MKKVVADHLLSLDGYASGVGDSIDWFTFDEESQEWSRNLLRAASLVIMGRRTYDLMMEYWPTPQAMKNEPVITERLTNLPKLVFSRTRTSSTWANSEFTSRAPAEVIRERRQENGGHILMIGSPNILAQLWDAQLIDELYLRIQPIVVGKGKPLFPQSDTRQKLELKESHRYQSGVTAVKYAVVR
jgi:dihydrofolate reductase